MYIKNQRGFAGIDISISIIIITIFIAMIGNLIININLNYKDTERKTIATSYAIQEIEKIKSQGYIDDYQEVGINQEDIFKEEDIVDENGVFTGYHKKVLIKDYILRDNTKQKNLVKEITIEISYKLANKDKDIRILTCITK